MAGPGKPVARRLGGSAGFTLLEVLIAVAILAVALTSLLGSQINSMQATRYARDITSAALLADYQLIELEFQSRDDGWVNSDVEVEGDFSDQGWPEVSYRCTIHFIELPEYNDLIDAKEESDEAAGQDDDGVVDAGEQAFGALGIFWTIIKEAIENSVRRVECTVYWKTGKIDHEYSIETFWTDPAALTNLPSAGGEAGDEQQEGQEGEGSGQGQGQGQGGTSGPGGSSGGAGRPALPGGATPGGMRGGG